MRYQLLILSFKDKKTEYFAKKYLVETLGFDSAKAQKLLSKLPVVIWEAETSEQLTELDNQLTELGTITQINQPSTKFCTTHIEKPTTAFCLKCNITICGKCQQENNDICSNCVQKKHVRKRWIRYRQAFSFSILLIVLFIAAQVYYRDHRKLDWDRTYNVALVQVVKGNKNDTARALSPVGKELIQQSLEKWFENEAKRVYKSNIKPFRFELLGPVFNEQTPPVLPTEKDGFWTRYKQTSAFISYFSDQLTQTGVKVDQFDIKLYLYIYPSDTSLGYEKQHSVGTTRGRFGVVFLPIGKQSAGRTTCLIAHEILHTVGASDKYDDNHLTIFPDGYFAPDKRYPQEFAEIMALAIPTQNGKEKDADSLEISRIGEKTSLEIGWKKSN
jgi:hypothetical protein